MRIVIVDDAAVERAVFALIVLRLGHELAGEAADLEAGRRLVERCAPDVIVVDGRLPEGVAAITALREAAPQAAIAAIVALGERALVQAAREAGASAVLLRPMLGTQVEAALRDLGPRA